MDYMRRGRSPACTSGRPRRPREAFRPRHLALAGFVVVALLASALSVACDKGYSRFMKLPADPAVSSGIGWGMVDTAYATMRSEPTRDSKAVAVIRGGTVFRCLERKIDSAGEDLGGLWYRYNDGTSHGWLHDADIKLFPSEEQARRAAQMESGVKR